MSTDPHDLPLPPWAIESERAFRHDTEPPELPEPPPQPELVIIDKEDGGGPDPDVPPSMPSYQGELTSAPELLPISPRRRLLLHGEELEPLHIFPPEGRRLYVSTVSPWVCVCQVTSGSAQGSGVLIGPRHVLTASHVIDWGPILFLPGFQMPPIRVSLMQGSTIATASATAWVTYEHVRDVTYTNADDDYSVIVLNARLGDTFGYLGAKTYNSDWDNETAAWRNIAYAPDMACTTPVVQQDFFLDEDDFDLGGGRMLITKTADMVHGMSGSPVFGFWGGGPYVVGVVSAATNDGDKYNAVAGGNNLTRLVNWARAAFP